MTELSATEAATVARFDAAPAADESAVERVARAIWESRGSENAWWELTEYVHELYRQYAAAAIAAMRPTRDAPQADEGDPVLDFLWRLRKTAGDDRVWVSRIDDAIDERRALAAS